MSRSYTTTRQPGTTTSTQTPEQPTIKPRCKCDHVATRLTSHSSSNPDRVFYSCYRQRSDPARCNYFKWEDQLLGTTYQAPPSTSAARTVANLNSNVTTPTSSNGNTLGRPPANRLPVTPTSAARPISAMTQPRASQFPGSLTEEEDDIEDVKPFGTAPLSIRITPPPEMDHIMEGQDDLSDWQQVEVDAVLSQASTESERSVLRAQRVGAGSRSMLNKLQAAAVAVDHNPEESHGVTVKQGKRKWTDGEANEGGGDAERTPRKSQWQSIQDDQDNPFHARHQALQLANRGAVPPTPISPDRHLGDGSSPRDVLAAYASLDAAAHEALSPVAAYIAKQDQKLRAAQKQKDAYLGRIKALEVRVRELEGIANARSR